MTPAKPLRKTRVRAGEESNPGRIGETRRLKYFGDALKAHATCLKLVQDAEKSVRFYLPLDQFAQNSQHKDGTLHVYIHERLGEAYSELKRARYALGVLEGHKEEYAISERNIEDKRKAMEQTLSDLDLPPSSDGGYQALQKYLHGLDFVHVKDGLAPSKDTLESVCAHVASICIIGSTFVDSATIGKLDELPLPPDARKRRCVSIIHAVPLFQNCVPPLICIAL